MVYYKRLEQPCFSFFVIRYFFSFLFLSLAAYCRHLFFFQIHHVDDASRFRPWTASLTHTCFSWVGLGLLASAYSRVRPKGQQMECGLSFASVRAAQQPTHLRDEIGPVSFCCFASFFFLTMLGENGWMNGGWVVKYDRCPPSRLNGGIVL